MMKPKIINLRRTLPLIFFCTLCVFLITSPGAEASYITGSSQWGNTGSSIYYNNGNVGVGTATPSSKMEITGGPLRLTGTYLDINRIGSAASGINWYSQANNAWVSYMSPTGAGMGPKGNLTAPAGSLVNSWALRSFIESSAGYGWTFESGVLNGTTPVVKFEIRSSDGAFHSYGNGLIDGNVGIGIGTTNPPSRLVVKGTGTASTTSALDVQNNAGTSLLFVRNDGTIGINSTTPSIKLSVNGGTGNVIDVGGGFVSGLNSTPYSRDQAVPLSYLQDNYTSSSTVSSIPSFWAGSSTADIWNTNLRNVGIGTSNPNYPLDVNGNVRIGTNLYLGSNSNNSLSTDNTNTYNKAAGMQYFVVNGSTYIMTLNGYGMSINNGSAGNTAGNGLIVASGNVGIGTTNPSEKLDVYGNIQLMSGGVFARSTATNVLWKLIRNDLVGSGDLSIQAYNGIGFKTAETGANALASSFEMYIKPGGNVGIGTTAPKNKLDVAGGMALGSYAGVNTAPSNSLIVSGNIGINSTTPNYRLSISSSTADVINVGGGFVSGLNSTPINRDQAIPLGYLQDNYTPSSTINSTLFWGGSSTADIWNTNARNVGIGTSSPAQKLDVIGSIRTNNQLISTVANGTAPLVVTSGTLVTNLNADLLDGIDSARIPYLNNTTGEVLDANTLTAAVRIYRTTAGGTNFPVATNNGGVLNNYIAYDSNYGYQMFSQVSAGNMYWRTKSAGTWGAWKTIYDNGNLTNALTTNYLTKWNGSKLANSLIYDNGTNVGIGTTSTQYKLSLSSTNDKIGLYFDATRYSNIQFYNSADGGMYFDNQNPSTGGYNWQIAGANKMVLTKAGKVGIGSTTPSVPLSFGASTGDVINIAGGFISGLTIVPENRDQAVSYGFLTDNFAPITSLASSSWLLDGNTVGQIKAFGTLDKYDIPFMTNGTERMRLTDLGNLVLGATSTGVRLHVESPSGPVAFFKSKVNGGNYSGYLGNGNTYSGEEFGLYYALNDTRLAVYDVANSVSLYGGNSTSSVPIAIKSSNGYVGINTTTPTANLHVVGSAIVSNDLSIGGNITMSGAGSNISVNKLTVNTVDPLYNIQGINYASFAASIVGGVKEECLGRIKIDQPITDKEYEKIIDFNQVKAGSDLWVWRRVVDFNSDNVQVLITPYGGFANVYYEIKDNRLIFRADRPVEISYRLVGNRFDWKQWPTKALDQKEKAGFILR